MTDQQKDKSDRNVGVNPYKVYKRLQKKQSGNEITKLEAIKRDLQWDGIKKIPNGFQKWPYVNKFWSTLHNDKKREAVKVIISILGLGATGLAAIGLFLTYFNTRYEQKIAEQRLISDRFAKAVDLLSKPDINSRIGAIYALERIAKDSPKDHWTIMKLLARYVPTISSLSKEEKVNFIKEDVKAALQVIGNREVTADPITQVYKRECTQPIELTNRYMRGADLRKANFGQNKNNCPGASLIETNLSKADLSEINLSRANLLGSNLSEAKLGAEYETLTYQYEGDQGKTTFSLVFPQREANLSHAIIDLANLRKTNLNGANLYDASLTGTDLTQANLSKVNLSKTDLRGANLTGANLRGANLTGANLTGANLTGANLTDAKLTQAQFEGKDHPLICNLTLPNTINIDPDRDCDKIAAFFYEKYPYKFSSLEEAEKYVQQQRQKKWD